jgi:hypothetical protein
MTGPAFEYTSKLTRDVTPGKEGAAPSADISILIRAFGEDEPWLFDVPNSAAQHYMSCRSVSGRVTGIVAEIANAFLAPDGGLVTLKPISAERSDDGAAITRATFEYGEFGIHKVRITGDEDLEGLVKGGAVRAARQSATILLEAARNTDQPQNRTTAEPTGAGHAAT